MPSSDLSVTPRAVPAVSWISGASRPRADPAHQCPLGTKQIDRGPVKPAQHQVVYIWVSIGLTSMWSWWTVQSRGVASMWSWWTVQSRGLESHVRFGLRRAPWLRRSVQSRDTMIEPAAMARLATMIEPATMTRLGRRYDVGGLESTGSWWWSVGRRFRKALGCGGRSSQEIR